MILLVVGLVAVIVVVLIAVFLSIRLGRGDDHDDETDLRPSSRSRRVDEDGWREPGIRDVRRSPQAARGAGRGIGERPGGVGDARRRNGDPGYGGARDRTSRTRDRGYDDEPRRAAGRNSPEYARSPARRRSAAPVSSEGRGRNGTGSPRRVAADDFPSADYPAMDFSTGEHDAAGYPGAGHTEDYPSADYGPTSYPSREASPETGEYQADDFASGELPAVSARAAKRPGSRRKAAPAPATSKSRSRPHRGKRDDDDDWPSNNDSEWDKLSDEQYWAELSADKPLATMARPARPAGKSPASSAKAAPAKPGAAKRPREERDARTARPAAAAARLGGVEELSRVPAGGRSAGRTAPERDEDRGSRGRRERPAQHDAVTERLPVRSRQPAVPAARIAAEAPAADRDIPVGAHSSLDTGSYVMRDAGRHPSLDAASFPVLETGRHPSLDAAPLPVRETGRHPSLDAATLPVRETSRHPSLDAAPLPTRETSRHPSLDTGPHATRGTGAHARDAAPLPVRNGGRHPSLDTGPRPVRDPNLGTLPGTGAPPPPVPGALEDDPLTSPSFAMRADPATDSRSYGHARKSSRAADPGGTSNNSPPPASDPLTSNGASQTGSHHNSGSYLAADYSSSAHAYPTEPAAAAAQWYGAPPAEPAPAPGYGNPYSYPEAGQADSPTSVAGDPGYAGYLADPLRVYSSPPYESPVSAYPDPSGTAYPALPAQGMAPATGQAGPAYPEAYPQHPYTHGEPPPYPDGSGAAGYAPGYENGYGGDPYAGGGYSGYPPQG